MTASEEDIRALIAEQAADWLVSNRSGAAGQAERAAFMHWLRTSPLHVEEYLRIAAVSQDLGSAASAVDATVDELLAAALRDPSAPAAALRPMIAPAVRGAGPPWPAGRGHKGRWTRSWRLGGAVAAAGVLAVIALLRTGSSPVVEAGQRYATGHGEQHVWPLTDGSTLQLNTDSEVSVHYSRGERHLELSCGQAYFSVAKDAQRRFRVTVGGADVVAVGTQFDIARYPGTAVVTVAEGRIAVYRGAAPAPGTGLGASGVGVRAGEQLDLQSATGGPRSIDLDRIEAWRLGRLVFEQQPLGQVVEEFNRYAAVPIEVDDPRLRTLPVSGAFDARDSESLIAFLEASDHVVVVRGRERIRVLRPAAAPGASSRPHTAP